MKHVLFRLFTELSSSRLLSTLTGAFAKSRISKLFIPAFASIYKINIAEAEFSPTEYPSLNAFFTRKLKPGSRIIDSRNQSLVSPVDARITAIGKISEAKELLVKGQLYTPLEILGNYQQKQIADYTHFAVLYLSPTDYHRIHAPIDGKWKGKQHVAGSVYPVHDPALTQIKGVLKRNERLTTFIEGKFGEVALCKVGAMNVASIKYLMPEGKDLIKGNELACFEFGSTVVLFVSGAFSWDEQLREGGKVKLGQAIGFWEQP